MQVYCSNCNTAHPISQEELNRLTEPVINCKGCEKKIKMQFCPGCGAFYSITFSNIQPGNYRYRCKKCNGEFMITIPAPAAPKTEKNENDAPVPVHHPASKEILHEIKTTETSEKIKKVDPNGEVAFAQNSINTFTVSELFSVTATSFSIKKIAPSAAIALIMLIIVRIFTMMQTMFPATVFTHPSAASVFFNLLPATALFSFYTVAAAVVSKVTLERIFYNRDPEWENISSFALKKTPAILACNATVMLLINCLLVLFGKIPMFGPLLFSIAFLPIYLFSISIVLLFSAGLWFYPPVAAHRESGMLMNLKDLWLFIKKHNLNLLYMVPVALMLTIITFAVIFTIHSIALSLTISVSKAILSGDASAIFSGIPALFIKISESALSGINGSIFRELSSQLTVTHHLAGLIIGTSMTVMSVLLISVFFSVTATVSTHIYIMMERGLTVDDRRKALTLFILFMLLMVFILLRKIT